MLQTVFAVGALPWTPLGELTALPGPSSWINGGPPQRVESLCKSLATGLRYILL